MRLGTGVSTGSQSALPQTQNWPTTDPGGAERDPPELSRCRGLAENGQPRSSGPDSTLPLLHTQTTRATRPRRDRRALRAGTHVVAHSTCHSIFTPSLTSHSISSSGPRLLGTITGRYTHTPLQTRNTKHAQLHSCVSSHDITTLSSIYPCILGILARDDSIATRLPNWPLDAPNSTLLPRQYRPATATPPNRDASRIFLPASLHPHGT